MFFNKIILLLVLSLMTVSLISCQELQNITCFEGNKKIVTKGNGELTQQDIILADFEGIDFTGSWEVEVHQADYESITITTDENIFPKLIYTIDANKVLKVSNEGCISPTTQKAIVYMKNIKHIELTGAGVININTNIKTNDLKLVINGSGQINSNYDVFTNNLSSDISGSGEIKLSKYVEVWNNNQISIAGSGVIELKGKSNNNLIDIAGSGEYSSKDLIGDNYQIEISGSGIAIVNAIKNLNIEISGSGEVHFYGNPTVFSKNINGSGEVVKK